MMNQHPGLTWHRRMLFGTPSREAMSVAMLVSGQGGALTTIRPDIRFADRDAANRYRASVNAPLLPEPAASGEAPEPLEGAETEQAPATADRQACHAEASAKAGGAA